MIEEGLTDQGQVKNREGSWDVYWENTSFTELWAHCLQLSLTSRSPRMPQGETKACLVQHNVRRFFCNAHKRRELQKEMASHGV
jgi:hypothetical protein